MLEEKLNEDYEEDDDEEYDDDLQSAPIEDYEEEENKEKIESLDSIKKIFEKKGKKDGFINREDVFDAVAHLDLSDDELDSLIQYFKDKKIQVLSDSNDEKMMIMTLMQWNILIQILIVKLICFQWIQ